MRQEDAVNWTRAMNSLFIKVWRGNLASEEEEEADFYLQLGRGAALWVPW